jgi:DNA-binding SARP family transcriptional activator
MAPMEFCLLGPLVVRSGGTVVPVQRGNQRAILAALLLNANRIVSTEAITETLWGAYPPPSAAVTLRNYVRRLRQALGDAERTRITAQPRGYRISVDPGELDLSRFLALLESARVAARNGAWDQAASRARAALTLWRDEPLADVESTALTRREIPRLAEVRLQALEIRIDADLHLGRHADIIPELADLASAHPLHEHLHAQLMLALYRSGRPSEALAAFRRARVCLVEELGTEPGAELCKLHQRILTADHALVIPAQLAVQPQPRTGLPGLRQRALAAPGQLTPAA